MFSGPNTEVGFSFTVISNVEITTQKFANKVGTKFFKNAVLRNVVYGFAFRAYFSECILISLRQTLAW